MSVISDELWQDIIFDLPDDRQICVSVFKDGRFRLMERDSKVDSWGPSVEGWIAK